MPETLTRPLWVMPSVVEEPVSLARAKMAAAGAAVSTVMGSALLVALTLPAASEAMALTLMLPSPRAVRSAAASTTATAVAPAPLTVLVTVAPPLRLKVTATLAPASAVTVTTPEGWVASAAVAPPVTPLPRASTGAVGAISSRSLMVSATACELALPAASVATTLKAWLGLVSKSGLALIDTTPVVGLIEKAPASLPPRL